MCNVDEPGRVLWLVCTASVPFVATWENLLLVLYKERSPSCGLKLTNAIIRQQSIGKILKHISLLTPIGCLGVRVVLRTVAMHMKPRSVRTRKWYGTWKSC